MGTVVQPHTHTHTNGNTSINLIWLIILPTDTTSVCTNK